MVLCGAPVYTVHHAEYITDFAMAIIKATYKINDPSTGESLKIRIGGCLIHEGGLIYDRWGLICRRGLICDELYNNGRSACIDHTPSPSHKVSIAVMWWLVWWVPMSFVTMCLVILSMWQHAWKPQERYVYESVCV